MSAFLCSEEHINFIVNSSDEPRAEDFVMLVAENIRSLETRYPGRDFLDEWKAAAAQYTFKPVAPATLLKQVMKNEREHAPHVAEGYRRPKFSSGLVRTQIVKLCDCYDYQACETDDYDTTPAAKYIRDIRERALAAGAIKRGEMYDRLFWGF